MISPKNVLFLVVALLGGILVAWQIRTQGVVIAVSTPDHSAQTAVTLLELTRTREQLAKRQVDLAAKLIKLTESSEQSQASHDQAVIEHETDQIILGKRAVYGPGIQRTVDKQVTATNILDLVNSLRNLGAEAISVNNQRFTGTSW